MKSFAWTRRVTGKSKQDEKSEPGVAQVAKRADVAENAELAELEQELVDASADFSLEELREFLEADFVEDGADPAFKERLREKLWAEFEARAKPHRD